jgi:hypothetical protein
MKHGGILVFIDDSGDPGLGSESSPVFVIALVIFDDTLARLCAFLAFRLWRQAVENVGFGGLAQDIPPCPGHGFGPIKWTGMSARAAPSHINL